MFVLPRLQTPYQDPWLPPLEERLAWLQGGRRRVAYYYEQPNNSTFRYRAYNMVQALNAQADGEWRAAYFFSGDLHRLDAIVAQAELLVICRSGYNHQIAALVQRMHAQGKRVLFDIDDLVFDTQFVHLLIDTLALDHRDPRVWDDWFGMVARMGQTLRCCDGGITTNEFLAERMRDFSGLPVAVVPNFMNREQLALSDAVWAAKQASGFARDDTLTLGYFSGSPSHRFDYALVEPALARLLAQRPELRVMTVGYIEPTEQLAPFADRILRQPFHDYVNLQALVGSVELNLMPLQSNVFTHCKSELKYFEAAAVGTLSVASPAGSYAAAIQHGHNGYLARAHEWDQVLDGVLADLARYAQRAQLAQADARERFSWTRQVPVIARALCLAE